MHPSLLVPAFFSNAKKREHRYINDRSAFAMPTPKKRKLPPALRKNLIITSLTPSLFKSVGQLFLFRVFQVFTGGITIIFGIVLRWQITPRTVLRRPFPARFFAGCSGWLGSDSISRGIGRRRFSYIAWACRIRIAELSEGRLVFRSLFERLLVFSTGTLGHRLSRTTFIFCCVSHFPLPVCMKEEWQGPLIGSPGLLFDPRP